MCDMMRSRRTWSPPALAAIVQATRGCGGYGDFSLLFYLSAVVCMQLVGMGTVEIEVLNWKS